MLGSHFAVGARSFSDHLRLPFAMDQGDLLEAVKRLAMYWADAEVD